MIIKILEAYESGEEPKNLDDIKDMTVDIQTKQLIDLLMQAVGQGGGSDLPTPTVADAGSVVVVDNEGKYALGEAGGGGGLIVHITAQSGDVTTTYLMDKSYSEIKAAILSGIAPIFIEDNSEGTYKNYLLSSFSDADAINPYIVSVYHYDIDAADPVTPMEFMSDTESGVLTWTSEEPLL